MRLVCLHHRGNDFPRTARSNADRIDLALDKVLDNLQLFVDVDFPVGRLNDEVDSQSFCRLFGATLHVDEERIIQSLQHQSDSRTAGISIGSALATTERQQSESNYPQESFHFLFLLKKVSNRTAVTITDPMTICWMKEDTARR